MTEPRRPHGPRDPADAWAQGPKGQFWGLAGAAGLLAHDPDKGVLLQHRVSWSDQGGTWGIPGGARHSGEEPLPAALREANEEAGVPGEAVRTRFTHVFDVGYWSYTTVGTDVVTAFDPVIGDPESEALRWVPLPEVGSLPLHPGFGAAWPRLRERLEQPATMVVDAANVVGSRPDGWWRDRRGAARRLLNDLVGLAAAGVPGEWFGLDAAWRLWPDVVIVLEGAARGVRPDTDGVLEVVDAPADGDSRIAELSAGLAGEVVVVTSDRGLVARVAGSRRHTVGAGTLRGLL